MSIARPPIEWVEHVSRGDAAAFHARQMPDELTPTVWWFEVDRPAVVLGSAQPANHLDLDACRKAGVEVVRRRSGGGAVLLEPDDVTWVDVLIPTIHHRWTNDVTTSAWWLGDVWRQTIADLGVVDTAVHKGRMVTTAWSSRVCFAGIGGGEVVATSRRDSGDGGSVSKIVGISQRRTRSGARFQCALYHRWRPEHHVRLFAAPAPLVADLRDVVTTVEATSAEIRASFINRLTSSRPAA